MKIIPQDFVKAVTTITLVTTVLIIAACSTIPPSSTPSAPEGLSATEFYEKMAGFERMKPSLQRLAALEPELKELISQLTQIAQAAEVQEAETMAAWADAKPKAMPEAQVPAVVEITNSNTSSAEPKTISAVAKMPNYNGPDVNNNVTEPPSRGLYTLQLSAVTDKQKLLLSWQNMQQKQQQVLANLVAISQAVKVSGVTFYRIKAGFYNTLQEAKKACASLKQAGANCLVSDNRGEDIQ